MIRGKPSKGIVAGREREIIALYMAPIIRKTQALLRGNSSDLVLQLKRETLHQFLTKHGFPDAFSRRELGVSTSCVQWEVVYPIHVAAEAGDDETLWMLLEEGADPNERNSGGRTAFDIAQDANVDGSHAHVLGLLRRAVRVHTISL